MNTWQGEHVRLRAIEPADGPFIFELWQDPETQKLVSARIDFPGSLDASVKRAQELAGKKAENDEFMLIIEDAQGQPVGWINPHHCDRRVGVFRYGVAVLPRHRRRGYAREAAMLLIRYFFHELRYQKCNAGVFSYNPASVALQESLGMVREGRTRRVAFVHGQYHDCFQYGITAEEFQERHGRATEIAPQVPVSESAEEQHVEARATR